MLKISQYAGLQNTYFHREIKTVDLETVRKQEQLKAAQSEDISSLVPVSEEAESKKASRIADLENISLQFNKNDDYSYIGKDSNPETLDMQKAISDMKKDSVLQGYQYFVGNKGNFVPADMGFGIVQSASEDGIVIQK